MRHTTSYSGAIDAIGWLIFIEGLKKPLWQQVNYFTKRTLLSGARGQQFCKQAEVILTASFFGGTCPLGSSDNTFSFCSGIQGEFFYGKHQNTRFNHKWSHRSVAGDDFQQFETTWNHWETTDFEPRSASSFVRRTVLSTRRPWGLAQMWDSWPRRCKCSNLPGCCEQPWTYFSVTSFVSPLDG